MSTPSDIVDTYKSSQVFSLLDEPIDLNRPLKVAIIGGGYSGICAAYKLSTKLTNVDVVLYDKNPDFGGTWIENTYPGVSCDIPAHAYQYSFAPNPDWSKFYCEGPELLQYLQNCADKLGVRPLAKFGHEILKAVWDEEQGRWKLEIREHARNTEFVDTVDVVLTATGFLNNWKWPDIAGLDTFKGQVVHTAHWTLEPLSDPVWKTRKVAVIGCGSSGTQVVPELQPYVEHLDNYVRGRTWISQPFALGVLQKYPDWESGNHVFTEDEKRTFREQPEVYKEMLMHLEDFNHSVHSATHVGTKMQNFLRSVYEGKMREKLANRPDIAETLIPDFPLICRRMTPGVGYLEALCAENVTFIPKPIARVTSDGIETTDGNHRPYDVIITATGFDTTYIPRFPVIGQHDEDLRVKWKEHPVTYIGLCQDSFPNWFQISGPNSGVATGSLIMTIEAQSDYVVSCVRKLQRERIKYMVPKQKAVNDFQAYLDSYFPKTVWARKCRTWYKAGREDGKVTALWPGSSLHQYQALQQPRFEDYDYKYLYGDGDPAHVNGLYWLGNGFSLAEQENVPGTRGWRIGQAFSAESLKNTSEKDTIVLKDSPCVSLEVSSMVNP